VQQLIDVEVRVAQQHAEHRNLSEVLREDDWCYLVGSKLRKFYSTYRESRGDRWRGQRIQGCKPPKYINPFWIGVCLITLRNTFPCRSDRGTGSL
jgi:hypothetical protein